MVKRAFLNDYTRTKGKKYNKMVEDKTSIPKMKESKLLFGMYS